jgi:hypothetical protein
LFSASRGAERKEPLAELEQVTISMELVADADVAVSARTGPALARRVDV